MAHALTAALIAAAFAAPAAQARPDLAPGTQTTSGFGLSDAAQAGREAPMGPITKTMMPDWPAQPQTSTPLPTQATDVVDDDGFPWNTIAFVLAGAGLACAAAGTAAGMRRRSHRPRIAA